MKKRSKGWQGVWVAGILALTVPPYSYGQGAGNGALDKNSGTPGGSPSAATSSSQPDLTESQTMPTDLSDLRGAPNANKEPPHPQCPGVTGDAERLLNR